LLGNTMIRSIEELVPNQITGATGFGAVGGEDQFYGWAPDVQILTENDLKKIEK